MNLQDFNKQIEAEINKLPADFTNKEIAIKGFDGKWYSLEKVLIANLSAIKDISPEVNNMIEIFLVPGNEIEED